MTVSLTLELNTAAAQQTLQGMVDRMDNRQAFFAAVGDMLLRSVSDNFRNQRGPDGAAWMPLRPATIKARQRKGQLPLTILRSNTKGKAGSSLAGSINRQATNDELRVGSPVEYAAIHQLGGAIERAARSAKIHRARNADGTLGRRFVSQRAEGAEATDVTIPAHRIVIPARPFLGVSQADERNILDLAGDWLGLSK